MEISLHEADSLLAIDVGEITTRAVLFDVVEGKYRFLAVGAAPTTAGAPINDVSKGLILALERLQEVTGRRVFGEGQRLIIPEQGDGSGIDSIVATLSAGLPIRIVALGLLEDISLESARNLAATTYAQVVDNFSLSDRRSFESRLDAILTLRPDVVVIAGGIEHGATESVLRLVEPVRMACQLLPREQRPEVLYAGNQALSEEIKALFEDLTPIHIAPNLRPALELERLELAQIPLAQIFRTVRARQIRGVEELDNWTHRQVYPTATAFGRIIRFLSKVYDPTKGVLGIDVGASATIVAAAFVGDLTLRVYPHLGMGRGLPGLLEQNHISSISHWLPVEVSEDYIRDYIFNKTIYPNSLPVTTEELAIEHALARQVIQVAVAQASTSFPRNVGRSTGSDLPWFEPIVASGGVLTNVPSPALAMLMLLDALQPTGVTTFVLDQSNLAAPLGAAASLNPVLVVQVLESNSFLSLGTVISPVAHVRPGTPILGLRVIYDSGDEVRLEIKQGALEVVPLPLGQSARLHLQPLHRADVGMGGAGRGGNVRVMGGALGVVIDARGRPLRLSDDLGRRRDLFRKWIWTLGG